MESDKSPIPANQRRRPVTLTIHPDILEEARAFGVNTSRAAENGIQIEIMARRQEAWINANKEAVASHNRRIAEAGILITPSWVDK